MNLYNPVSEFYKDYAFDSTLPIILFRNYTDLLKEAQSVTKSCILVNTNKTVVDTKLDINFSYPDTIKVTLVLNVDLIGKSQLLVSGSNFTLSNIVFKGGDSTYSFPGYIVQIKAQKFTIVNFEMNTVKCANSVSEYIRVNTSVKDFKMYNSKLDGKFNVGVFLRLDFPYKYYIKNCVFQNFYPISVGNGGEMIRMATSGFENSDSFATLDSCYFTNCRGDPEVVSIKCSSVTVKNCVFSDNGGKRLTLRHTHRDTIEHCFFGKEGIRAYGTKHKFTDLQLVDGANILLDNKTGSSYVVAKDCTLTDIYHFNTPDPVTNKGINNTITNVVPVLKYPKETFFDPQSTGPYFKFIAQNRIINNNQPIEILTTENFNVEYVTTKIQSYTFILTKETAVILTQIENKKPYYLYGDNNGVPNYSSLTTVGVYKLQIKETGTEIVFKVTTF